MVGRGKRVMRKDFRVQYPLWQMIFILLFGGIAFSVTGASTEFINTQNELSYRFNLEALETIVMMVTLLLTIILFIIFTVKVSSHNKQNPAKKISLWQIRPVEYLEQDEGLTYITRRAAQKVYTFFVWSLPTLALLYLLMDLSKFWMIFGILFIAFMQYLIYYLEIRKHLIEGEE